MKLRVLITIVSITAALSVAVFVFAEPAGRMLWERYGVADVALLANTRDAALASAIGDYYYGGGAYHLKKALYSYKKALRIDRDVPWAHYQIARIHFTRGDLRDALDEINEELALHPENLRALYIRGLIYGYSWQYERAADDFERFTQYAPHEWAGYNDWGWVLARDGRFDEVVSAMEQAFRHVPDAEQNPWLWTTLGVAHLNLDEYEQAEEAFLNAEEFARALTLTDWRRAYPGNNPANDASGLLAFRKAIEQNIEEARAR